MNEERKIILEMLSEGKVTPEEADKLLSEIENKNAINETPFTKKFLRIRVDDGTDTKVNVNIPIALAEVGLKMIPKDKLQINGKEIKVDHILQLIEDGTEGELVNIDVNEKGKDTKIKIYID